jgi:hypothetical protein
MICRTFADVERAAARCDFHSAFAGARDLAVTKGFGPRPLPAIEEEHQAHG